jgi:hypothetical protein
LSARPFEVAHLTARLVAFIIRTARVPGPDAHPLIDIAGESLRALFSRRTVLHLAQPFHAGFGPVAVLVIEALHALSVGVAEIGTLTGRGVGVDVVVCVARVVLRVTAIIGGIRRICRVVARVGRVQIDVAFLDAFADRGVADESAADVAVGLFVTCEIGVVEIERLIAPGAERQPDE